MPVFVVATAIALMGTVSAASAATVKIPKNGVEKPPTASLIETGSTLLYPLWNEWAPAYQQLYSQVTIQTAGTGSGTGITDATNGTADIGASDAYLSPSENQATPSLLNIPLAISAQLVTYNLPGVSAHLKLNGKVLSKIYQGTVTTWNDPAITALNPGVTIPATPIVTLHRSDSSGDTFLFTQFLSKTDPSGWGTKISFDTTVPWPNVPGALGENGNSGMVAGCKATVGCVAYVGISYQTQALQAGLGYAQLQNAKGAYELPTQAAITAEAASFVKQTPPTGTISLIYGPAATGYPIINYEYAIVNSTQTDAGKAKAIRSVLEWAVNAKYGNSADYLGQVFFQPLPAKVAAQSVKQIIKIQ
ncbi:MAG TPA: phosphate ABC transporter substrate-binding protein PstS [Acidimicrobiales bacterium]|nr:phosphate ABC transporter substrate-binding protein PstS [Acidimicrobiales bacterium]